MRGFGKPTLTQSLRFLYAEKDGPEESLYIRETWTEERMTRKGGGIRQYRKDK